MKQIKSAKLRDIYHKMLEVRFFEEAAIKSWRDKLWRGSLHGCLAQEAPAAAMCAAMQDGDYFSSSHRGHGHYIAKGLDPNRAMAELFGRDAGYCHGRGGSMHTVDTEKRIFGNSMVGSGSHIAAGIGLAIKMRGGKEVVACSFGDGATNTGGWHEGINFAAVHKLPVIYLCENNNIAVWTRYSETTAVENISSRAAGYGMPGCTVDGTDAIAVYEACKEAVDRARSGQGPTLIEAKLYRWRGHTVWDPATHRSEEENEEWSKHDPIPRLESYLLDNKIITADEAANMKVGISGIMNDAVKFATDSPPPPLTKEEAMKYIYVD